MNCVPLLSPLSSVLVRAELRSENAFFAISSDRICLIDGMSDWEDVVSRLADAESDHIRILSVGSILGRNRQGMESVSQVAGIHTGGPQSSSDPSGSGH